MSRFAVLSGQVQVQVEILVGESQTQVHPFAVVYVVPELFGVGDEDGGP